MEQLGQEDPKSFTRLIWAMALMAVIFGATSWFMKSQAPPPARGESQKGTTTPGSVAAGGVNPTLPAATVEAPKPVEAISALQGEKEETFRLENDSLLLEFSSKGAILTKAVLKKFREKGGPNDDLVSPLAGVMGMYPLAVSTGEKDYDDLAAKALFHVEQFTDKGGAPGFRMVWSDGKGNALSKAFTLPAGKGYEMGLQISGKFADAGFSCENPRDGNKAVGNRRGGRYC